MTDAVHHNAETLQSSAVRTTNGHDLTLLMNQTTLDSTNFFKAFLDQDCRISKVSSDRNEYGLHESRFDDLS
jgi:hypothetical protein